MAKVKNPILFSAHFGVNPEALHAAGLLDPFLNVDTPLFIDPVLLSKSAHELIRNDALASFRGHFDNFLRLLMVSEREGDVAWKAAARVLDLSEPPDNGLGYGGSRRGGSSRPIGVRDAIMRTSKEILRLGSKDPEMLALMSFFEEDVGSDTISDFTTRAIVQQLATLTERFCIANGVPTSDADGEDEFSLPFFDLGNGQRKSVILVPSDILRELPMADEISEVYSAAAQNAKLRDRVNALLGDRARHSMNERKEAMRRVALESADLFEVFLNLVKEIARSYSHEEDTLGVAKLREMLSQDIGAFKVSKRFDLSKGPSVVIEVVQQCLEMFKHHVENGNLWEALWAGNTPKKERAAQLLFFAIADSFCKANNVDISPEANMGGGPIDFKFSAGYEIRVLVEMKRSQGTVKHGYERQLEIYKDAARTSHGIFVIIDYGGLGAKLAAIQRIREERLAAGEAASEIIVVDASRKASASKRD